MFAVEELSNTVHLKYQPWPDEEGEIVEFRLIFKGHIPSQNSGGGYLKDKHAIRRQLHPQLRELWHRHKWLKRYTKSIPGLKLQIDSSLDHAADPSTLCATGLDFIAKDFTSGKFRFVPLISSQWGVACSLDILFLRRDDPGNLIKGGVEGGDIDNRIKVLWDGLRMPREYNEIDKFQPEQGEDPFFCLLEDDELITEVKVTTDRLLLPLEKEDQIKDVHLVIHVKTLVLDSSKYVPLMVAKTGDVFGH